MDESQYSFQLMYMPMNSLKTFQNDGYSEVLGVLLPYTIYAFISLTSRFMDNVATSEEQRL